MRLPRPARNLKRFRRSGFRWAAMAPCALPSAGASCVIAISPQVSIHPRLVPWDKRYHKNAAEFELRLGTLGSRAASHIEGIIVFDPFVPFDCRHARRIFELYPRLRPVAPPFGGHLASGVLRAAGRAGLLMEMLARDGGPGLHDLRNTYRTILQIGRAHV